MFVRLNTKNTLTFEPWLPCLGTNQVASCSQKVSLAPKRNYPKNYKKKVQDMPSLPPISLQSPFNLPRISSWVTLQRIRPVLILVWHPKQCVLHLKVYSCTPSFYSLRFEPETKGAECPSDTVRMYDSRLELVLHLNQWVLENLESDILIHIRSLSNLHLTLHIRDSNLTLF